MAFRRRRRGGGGKRVQRQRLSWVATVFNESAQTIDGSLTEYSLVERANWGATDEGLKKDAHIKRIIVKGDLAWSSESTTFAQDQIACFMAAYVIDDDDPTGSLLVTTQGALLVAQRVVWTDCQAMGWNEVPSAQVGTQQGGRMRIDIDTRLNVVLKPDEILALGIQFGSDVTATIALASLSCVGRVLIEQP